MTNQTRLFLDTGGEVDRNSLSGKKKAPLREFKALSDPREPISRIFLRGRTGGSRTLSKLLFRPEGTLACARASKAPKGHFSLLPEAAGVRIERAGERDDLLGDFCGLRCFFGTCASEH